MYIYFFSWNIIISKLFISILSLISDEFLCLPVNNCFWPLQGSGNALIFPVTVSLEAHIQRCSYEKVFWKQPVNLLENTHVEVGFQKQLYWNYTSAWVSCIFSEHLFLRTRLEGCFCISDLKDLANSVINSVKNINTSKDLYWFIDLSKVAAY